MKKSFFANASGATAITFALSAVPILVAMGAGIDMIRENNANSTLQAATDAAAIAGAGAKKAGKSEGQIKTLVNNYLADNGAEDILSSVSVQESGYDKTTGVYYVRMKGKINSTFLALTGISTVEVAGYSEVQLGSGALELAMALDTTGSMNAEGRLDALKVAATSLVDKLLTDKAADTYIKIGMVPFADYVNVGVANRAKFWVDAPADTQKHECWNTYPNVSYSNCHLVTVNGSNDGVPVTYQQNVCDTNYGAAVQQCGMIDHKWNGVVGSRNNGLDTKVVGTGAAYPGLIDMAGPQALTDLTDDRTLLNGNISALTANSETYIPSGLLWAWELLDAADAFPSAKSKKEMAALKGTKALVLMTDGDNTKSADYPYHWGSDAAAADQKTLELCTNIKKEGITVYTVGFKVNKPSSLQMLKDCASSASQAFTAADNAALLVAFGDIADSLSQIRFTK